MAIARTEVISDVKHRVISYHSAPETLTEEQKAGTVTINTVPVAVQQVGKSAILYCNPQTGEVWYEYIDRPMSEEEVKTEEAKQVIEDDLLLDMMGRGVL